MPPIYLSDASTYDYDEIPPGYYYQAMLKGPAVQRFWHTYKSREIARSIAENSNVLDVGCGGGTFLYVLGQSRKNIEAIGVDIAQAQIDFCAQTIAPQFHKITFKKISAESLPFADASFDYVTSVDVIEHLRPFEAMQSLNEMRRVLKPNGRLLLTTPNFLSLWPIIEFTLKFLSPIKFREQHINCYTPNSLVKFIEGAGFEINSTKSCFIAAPFLAPLGEKLAYWVHRLERHLPGLFGTLIMVEATPRADLKSSS